jgi:hypothetical protein
MQVTSMHDSVRARIGEWFLWHGFFLAVSAGCLLRRGRTAIAPDTGQNSDPDIVDEAGRHPGFDCLHSAIETWHRPGLGRWTFTSTAACAARPRLEASDRVIRTAF